MADVSTTKMSSKGQIVVPSPPDLNEFDDLIAEARRKGRKVGLKKSDILDAVRTADHTLARYP